VTKKRHTVSAKIGEIAFSSQNHQTHRFSSETRSKRIGAFESNRGANGSSRAQLFKNPIFVAGRNFWRQQMLPQGQIQSKPWLILSKSVAARNFYRQQKLDFRKVHRKEVHFALSPSAFAPFRLDVDPDEVGPKSSKIVDFSKFSDIENFEKTTIFYGFGQTSSGSISKRNGANALGENAKCTSLR